MVARVFEVVVCLLASLVISDDANQRLARIKGAEDAIDQATVDFEEVKRRREQQQPVDQQTEATVVLRLAELHYEAALAWRAHVTTDRVKSMHHLSMASFQFVFCLSAYLTFSHMQAITVAPEMALSLNAHNYWNDLGLAHLDLGNREHARECFLASIQLKPVWTTFNNLAVTATSVPDRIEYLRKAIQSTFVDNIPLEGSASPLVPVVNLGYQLENSGQQLNATTFTRSKY